MSVSLLKIFSTLALFGVALLCFGQFQFFHGFSGTNQEIDVFAIARSAPSQISCGLYCTTIGSGLMLFILYPLRVALLRTSYGLRQWLLATLLMYIGCLAIFNVTMGFIGINEQIAMKLDAANNETASDIRSRMQSLFSVIVQLSMCIAIVVSALYAIVVLRKKCTLPSWSIFFTPIFIFLFLRELPSQFVAIAAPYGGWYQVAIGSVGLFIFFGIIVRYALKTARLS